MTRVAAIDCGTNSIRVLIADVTVRDDGTRWLRDVHREMRIVRLGEGVDATGRLSDAALHRTRAALTDYTTLLRRKGVEAVRMVATSASRDAENQADFFDMTAEVLGVKAEVISGDTEARLSFTGAVADLDPSEGPFVLSDVGGGSTELVVGDAHGLTSARSVDIGCVRLTERTLHGDPPTADEVAEARAIARETLAGAFDAVPVAGARTWIGVAGTVTTLAAIAQDLPEYDSERIHLSRIGLDEVDRITAALLAATHDERAAIGSMHPGRVDVIVGGAIVVQALSEGLRERGADISELVASEHDILDGIAFELAGQG